MSGSRKNRPLRPFTWLLLLGAVAFAAGCSTANTPGGDGSSANHIDASGKSVPGWVVFPSGGSHAGTATQNYIANGGSSSCTECHGSDLTGGVSRVSCFGNPSCHHGPVVAGWVATPPAAQNHGLSAKKAPGSSGFASCQICHQRNFTGGETNVSCFLCHGVSAPHPAPPWRGSPYTHATTDPANAQVCAQCHFPGSPNNPANHPATPAAAGTPPGCFNNTLCHGEAAAVPHPVDNAWVTAPPAAQPHGNDAKAAPGATTGFSYCQVCHGTGTNFAGGSSGISCLPCHGGSSPHPAAWRTGDTYVHTSTAEGNAPVCAFCHLNGTNSPIAPPSPPAPAGTAPGCFNGTLCHATAVPHPVGASWVTAPPAAQPHGNDAKAVPGTTNGFAYCQVCHGTGTTTPANFGGGSSGVSCYPCHAVSAPHAPGPWRASAGSTYNHTNTATGNAPVCQQCHFPGSPNNPAGHPAAPAPAGTPPGCFNSTLCHNGGGGAAHAVPFNDNSHFTVTAATFPGSCSACHDVSAPTVKSGPVCQTCHIAASPLTSPNCTSCHASPPSGGAPAGAAYPNLPGAHATHIALNGAGTPVTCDTCHNGLGTNTLNHYNRAKTRVAPGDAVLLATYNAETVPFSFDNAALSCSNVSCHGGQATPNWQTGTLDVNNQCTNCHVSGATQFNSYASGEHTFHVNLFGASAATCKLCHNTTALAVNHLTALGTSALEGPASATIGGVGTLIPAGNYVPATGSCTPSCHGNESW